MRHATLRCVPRAGVGHDAKRHPTAHACGTAHLCSGAVRADTLGSAFIRCASRSTTRRRTNAQRHATHADAISVGDVLIRDTLRRAALRGDAVRRAVPRFCMLHERVLRYVQRGYTFLSHDACCCLAAHTCCIFLLSSFNTPIEWSNRLKLATVQALGFVRYKKDQVLKLP